MKKILIGLVIAASSLTVVASEIAAYNAESVAVLLATEHCPEELAELSRFGLISSVASVSGDGQEIHVLNFTSEGTARALYNSVTGYVGTLTITRGQGGDSSADYSCTLAN